MFLSPMYLKVFLLFFVTILSTQAQELDHETIILEYQKTNNLKNFKAKQDSIYKLSRKIIRINSKESLLLYKTLDSLVTNNHLKLSYLRGWATSESRFGNSNYSKILRKKGLKIANKYGNPKDQFDYTNILASFYINKEQVDSATYYSIAAEKLVNQYPDDLNQFLWNVDLENYYIQGILGNDSLQDKYIEKSWTSMTNFPNQNSYGFLLYLITDHYRKRNNHEKHVTYTELLINYYDKKKVNTPNAHFPVETVLFEKDSPEAINQLKKVFEASDKINSLKTFSYTSTNLARLYLENNQPDHAIEVLERALFKLDSANYQNYQSVKFELLQKAYIQKNNYSEAYKLLGLQKQREDSLRSKEQLDKIADYEIQYETEKKTAQIELLQEQNTSKEKQKQLYLILAFSGLIIASLLGIFSYINRKQKLKLVEQKKELEETVEEKNVLFKEIHHRVKNSLQMVSSLLFLQAQNVGNIDAKNAIKDAQNRVRSLSLIHQKLYSRKHITGVETRGYFTDLTQDIFDSHQLEAQRLNYHLDIDSMVLNVETLTPLGLILNELIVNVLKHAFTNEHPKNTLNIKFYKKEERLVLEVSDNGIGYKNKEKKNSFGLKLINSLAKKLDATFTIQSTTPNGIDAVLIVNDFEIINSE